MAHREGDLANNIRYELQDQFVIKDTSKVSLENCDQSDVTMNTD